MESNDPGGFPKTTFVPNQFAGLPSRSTEDTILRLVIQWLAEITPKKNEVQNAYARAIEGTFNPLLKVLCTFPLWYLSAIGLGKIMSFTQSLLCDSRSSPKERNSVSMDVAPIPARAEQGSHLSLRPFQRHTRSARLVTHQHITAHIRCGSGYELFPLHSPLLGISLAFSSTTTYLYA